MRKLPIFCAILISPLSLMAGNGAIEAMQAIPADYVDTIVSVSGRGASPNPAKWEILAYEGEVGDSPRGFIVEEGEVRSNKASFRVGEMLAHATIISLASVRVDSSEVFAIAEKAYAKAGGTLAQADMTLTQDGEGGAPTWKIRGYGQDGKSLGDLVVSSSDGAILQ